MDTYERTDCPLQGLGKCTKKNCAWWDGLEDKCAILVMAQWLAALHTYMPGAEEGG